MTGSVGLRAARLAGVLLALLGSACTPHGSPTGAAGVPRRIASVNVAADEILADLVPPERVVAVSAYVDDPGLSNAAGRYPDHVPRIRAELETMLALHPDLVCTNPYNSADFLEVLHQSGLATFRFEEVTSFDGIRAGVLALGTRVGEQERARDLVDAMDRRLAEVARALEGVASRPRVYYWAAGWTAGRDTTIGELIGRAGAVNAAAEGGRSGMFELSLEQVLALDPDVLVLDARDSLADLPGRELPPQLRGLRAVREGRVLHIPGRALGAISHHVVSGVEALARALHPERFPGTPR